ncbi:MAG: calcium/sodium antiporter [Acidobacteria bacterium]|nr:calcium/sodium antiporter [Acidobacteriota bacterium]
MNPDLWRWIGNGEALADLVAGLPSWGLLLLIVASIAVLSKSADWMIDGVVHLARRTGLPRIVIGATVISLGTTTPEAFVSVTAAWMGNPGLALGNGVGSIICDTGLIFGLTVIIAAVPVNRFILNRTGWVQVGSATLLVVLSLFMLVRMPGQPTLTRWVGIFLLVLLAGYLYVTYYWAKKGAAVATAGEAEESGPAAGLVNSLILILGGLLLIIVAARIMVPSAAELAHRIGVPEDVIAATMVAFGTSLPELMTAIAAIRRGHPEITVGNIVGADVLNCLFVIGAAAAAKPLEIPSNFFLFHFPAMLIILYSFRIFISMNKDGKFKRWQGAWLLGVYLVYIVLQYSLNIGPAEG